MLRAIRRTHVTKSALVPAVAAALAAAAAMASCITGPPADLPQVPVQGPTIIQDAVRPPANEYLTRLPETFVVPVRVFNPDTPIDCNVFVDFDPGPDNSQSAKGAAKSCGSMLPALEGGVTSLEFSLSQTDLMGRNAVDPNACHTIQCFVVAGTFNPVSRHTPGNSLGADSVTWQYAPNGPGSCEEFDAGDGASSAPDASDGGVLLVPDGVGSPL
jgi:hypothetical protein